MQPLLFRFELPLIGEIVFPAYFTLLMVGFACALLLSWRDARKQGIDPDKIVDLNLYMVLFGLLGARLLHLIADGQAGDYLDLCLAPETIRAVGEVPARCTADAQCGSYFLCNAAAGHCHPPRDCLLVLKVWRGGLAYYGGFLFASAFGLYYLRRQRLPIWRVADLAGYGIPLGLFWGRLGCYLNGCCFGKVTGGPWGVAFPRGGASWRQQLALGLVSQHAAGPLPVHPTQLYSALLNLGIFFVCYFVIAPRKRFDGQVFWSFVLLYALSRSAVELLRDDDRGIIAGLLSTSQLISLPLFFLAAVMLWRGLRRGAAAPPWPPAAGGA